MSDKYIMLARLSVIAVLIFLVNANSLVAETREITATDVVVEKQSEEVLWLARVLYSETKIPEEQLLVAWVVRNRVENNFRGATSYKEVALSPKQFSGLHPNDGQYHINMNMDYDTENTAWKSALSVAEKVYDASGILRPIPESVMHFYSPISVSIDPEWTAEKKPILVVKDKDDKSKVRFAFYEGIR